MRREATYANVMATLALFLALGGTGYAASQVGTSGIKNNAVTSAKLASNAVTSAKIKSGAVTKAKLAKGSVTAAALGPGSVTGAAIGPGAVSSGGLAAGVVSWKTLGAQVVAAAPVNLPQFGVTSGTSITQTAACPSGMVAISGGETFSDITNDFVLSAAQAGGVGSAPTGWTAVGANGSTTATSTMTVYAICINAGS